MSSFSFGLPDRWAQTGLLAFRISFRKEQIVAKTTLGPEERPHVPWAESFIRNREGSVGAYEFGCKSAELLVRLRVSVVVELEQQSNSNWNERA